MCFGPITILGKQMTFYPSIKHSTNLSKCIFSVQINIYQTVYIGIFIEINSI